MSQSATTSMRALPHSTPRERADHGKEARRRSPRSGHAVYRPSPDRPEPLAILEEQSAARVPELVPIRYSRMTEFPFRFYRGAAAIMASDLAGSPDSGITAQLCGDAHLLNFRLLASPERRLMFDINDFDETLPGPWASGRLRRGTHWCLICSSGRAQCWAGRAFSASTWTAADTMVLTRMPYGPSSRVRERVRPSSPAFGVLYATMFIWPARALTLPMSTIRPQRRSITPGVTGWQVRWWAGRFTSAE